MRSFPLSPVAALLLILSSCAALKTRFVSPDTRFRGSTGDIGGDGDSVALWIAILGLTAVALVAYPAQRKVRLAWNSWRNGSSGKTRSRKGKDLCIKSSEWES